MRDDIFYFGCVGQAGHYLWFSRNGRPYQPFRDEGLPADFPLKNGRDYWLDGWFSEDRRYPPQGVVVMGERDGWTLMGFTDFSVDKRPNSNSTFLARGEHTFEEMKALAAEHFPTVWARFTFPLVLREAIPA